MKGSRRSIKTNSQRKTDNKKMLIRSHTIIYFNYDDYDFSFYEKYIKQVSTENTKIIFDTIRPDYFKKVFQNVEIIDSKQKEIHSSKRVLCNKFLD